LRGSSLGIPRSANRLAKNIVPFRDTIFTMGEPIDLEKYRKQKEAKRKTAEMQRGQSSTTEEIESSSEAGGMPMKITEEIKDGKTVRMREPDFDARLRRDQKEAERPRNYDDAVTEQEAIRRAMEIIEKFPQYLASSGKVVNQALNESITMDFVLYKGRAFNDPVRERMIRNRQMKDIFEGSLVPEPLFATALLVAGKAGLEYAKKLMPGFSIDFDDDMDKWRERNPEDGKK
jgi:hypothetical protein